MKQIINKSVVIIHTKKKTAKAVFFLWYNCIRRGSRGKEKSKPVTQSALDTSDCMCYNLYEMLTSKERIK
ncbi:MAG: hypothetical protein IJO36_05175 [Clostridia bacterium]|nr:hypothetical protein [Clostridia bacterium]